MEGVYRACHVGPNKLEQGIGAQYSAGIWAPDPLGYRV